MDVDMQLVYISYSTAQGPGVHSRSSYIASSLARGLRSTLFLYNLYVQRLVEEQNGS